MKEGGIVIRHGREANGREKTRGGPEGSWRGETEQKQKKGGGRRGIYGKLH